MESSTVVDLYLHLHVYNIQIISGADPGFLKGGGGGGGGGGGLIIKSCILNLCIGH